MTAADGRDGTEARYAELLREAVSIRSIAQYSDRWDVVCFHCGVEWPDLSGIDPGKWTHDHERHDVDCWVLRVRAALEDHEP